MTILCSILSAKIRGQEILIDRLIYGDDQIDDDGLSYVEQIPPE